MSNNITKYNRMVTFKSLNEDENALNFIQGILKYYENTEKFIDILKCIEENDKTISSIDDLVLPSFKSNVIFSEDNNDDFASKFQLLRLKFESLDNFNKAYKLLKYISSDYDFSLKCNRKKLIIHLYLEDEQKEGKNDD